MDIKRKLFGELKQSARDSRSQKLREKNAPKPKSDGETKVTITISKSALDEMAEHELDELTADRPEDEDETEE